MTEYVKVETADYIFYFDNKSLAADALREYTEGYNNRMRLNAVFVIDKKDDKFVKCRETLEDLVDVFVGINKRY